MDALRPIRISAENRNDSVIDDAHTVQDTILPDAARANVGRLDGLLNSMLLIELVKRAETGKPLLTDIEQLYAKAQRELPKILRKK